MDIVYRLQGTEFEWDEKKARSNIQKHGVTLKEAAEVFFDPFYQTGDASVDESEGTLSSGILSLRVFYWLYTRNATVEQGLFPLVRPLVSKGKFMKKRIDQTPRTEEGFDLNVRSRASKPVTIHIPAAALASLEKTAAGRHMSVEALLKLYIGQSMRQRQRSFQQPTCWKKTQRF